MNLNRQIACAALVIALFGGAAIAAQPPCAIGNHYILDVLKCQPPGPVSQTPNWELTGSMSIAREQHSAVLLPNGKVLVAGGRGERGILDSAELYDPDNGSWTLTGRMSMPRNGHSATLLPDGRVLVAGGATDDEPPNFGRTSSVELFDPATGTWSLTGNMRTIRDGHAAVRLQDGKVLVAGGFYIDTLSSAELYDPGSGTWSTTGELNAGRFWHSMTLLQDGRVLAAKGSNDGDLTTTLASAELYDPVAGAWTRIADSGWGSVFHTATLLPTGKVLFTAGNGGGIGGDIVYIASELFDPETRTWISAPALLETRYQHSATLLKSGAVLITGGVAQASHYPTLQYITRAAVDYFDPATSGWSAAAQLGTPRLGHSSTLLADGRVLVAGGYIVDGGTHRSAEILKYQLATPAATVIEFRDLQDFPGSPGGHFFYTDAGAEVALLDLGTPGRFTRTGRMFKSVGTRQVCRFYGSTNPGPNAHFYTISAAECAQLKALQITPTPNDVQQWNYEGLTFAQEPPVHDATGDRCPVGTSPVFRAYNNAFARDGSRNPWDSVHRYATSRADIDEMVNLFGWRDEGIAFCSRQ